MTTIEERRLNFLNEKLGYFIEDPSRRAYNQETESCMYWDKSTGNKCLIGRELPEDKYSKNLEGNSIFCKEEGDIEEATSIFDLLPIAIQELDIEFLYNSQKLHDNSFYWTLTGLSEIGLKKLNDIKKTYCNVN